MKLSVLIASMNRKVALGKLLWRLIETTKGHEIEIIVAVDEDVNTVQSLVGYPFVSTLIFNQKRHGALACWNQALALSTGDMLFPCGDDQWPHMGWLDRALAVHRNKLGGYGCVGFNDLMHAPTGPAHEPVTMTTLIFDRRFCKEVFGGVVAIPCYKYLCVDCELNDRARAVGKLAWCEDAIVEHLHPANGKRQRDALDDEHAQWAEQDRALYEARKAAGFPNDFKAVL